MDIQSIILRILFWVFFILGVIFFIWYFVGDSPTLEQGLLFLILGGIIQVGYSTYDNKHLIERNNEKIYNLTNRLDTIETKVDKLER